MKKGTQALSLCSWGYVWGWGYQDGLEEVTDGHRGVPGAGGDLSGLGEGPDGLGSIRGARGDQDGLIFLPLKFQFETMSLVGSFKSIS